MAIEQTNSHFDPAVGETEGYITANDMKLAFIQTYTDLASKSDLSALVPDSLELTKTYVDAQDALALPLAGGTLTGPLILDADPTDPLEASTKTYVDAHRAGRNRIINGDFSVNQRAFTSITTSAFGFDRWKMFASGGTSTYSAQTATLGELPESAASYARLVSTGQSAASDFTLLRNKIEDVRTLSGKTATVSFWAKASTGTPKVAVDFAQTFGTGGSPSTWVSTYAGQVTISTTWTRYSITVDIPSISGKTMGTNNDSALELSLWTSAGTTYDYRTGTMGIQSVTVDFWGVQVEEGPIATPFEVLPYAEQLRMCQRYYYRPNSTGAYSKYGTGIVNATTTAVIAIPLYVPMRATPTASYSGSVRIYDTSAAGAVTGIAGDQLTTDQVSLMCTASGGGLTIGRAAMLMNNNSTTAYIALDAEL